MTLSLSLKRIADAIYAQSALDAAARSIDTPATLTRSHSAAIEKIILQHIAETIASLGPIVKSSNLGTLTSDDDIIIIECDVPQYEASAVCLRTNIETAVAYGVLARASANTDTGLADWYRSLAKISALPINPRIVRSA